MVDGEKDCELIMEWQKRLEPIAGGESGLANADVNATRIRGPQDLKQWGSYNMPIRSSGSLLVRIVEVKLAQNVRYCLRPLRYAIA